MRKYALPALSQLHTFEAVSRRMSFTAAADELCLTQSAVSRQVKSLERDLGRPLFVRKHRAIEHTPDGLRLFEAVTRGLDEIAHCVRDLRATTQMPQITVAASVAFSYYWLMPRLEHFAERHPEIDLRVLASDQKVDLSKQDADVAVLYGRGGWDGVDARRLFGEKVYPVCSPAYLQAHQELQRPSDLLDQTLLHLEGGGTIWGAVDWQAWLVQQGVTGQPVRRGIRLNSYPMVLQGAEAGRGVALGWSYITDEMLASGQLVCPFDSPIETQNSYYIGALSEKALTPSVSEFIQWIIEECEALG
ncbi:transcriptional regulator GcvA [Octadecabacter sp. 1_MG-2023]|uniref:transcriptional regulator GcvA n=1 Tax=unclassified Octadecabacter TaxID=196158 RepID=UPI001C0A2078|nr:MULTISPECIES: transcriptional regulator GcvA [unclassified Octadecabacter]MBU2994682.1 transcriptional regulator GcvA [Octadecabacter sp. B2R22]MDO6734024.1 transcriptional regulator GcvA [Octadecabacter sp. 1_MG-2023]